MKILPRSCSGFSLAVALLGSLALAPLVRPADPLTPAEAQTLAEEAFIFAYPMLENYRVMYNWAIDEKSSSYVGGWNRFRHGQKLAGPTSRLVVRPNNDTLYSRAVLDLRREPLVVTLPSVSADRYWSLQVMDLYTHNVAIVSPRTTPRAGDSYLITAPDWRGAKPAGIAAVLPAEGSIACILVRLAVKGPVDVPAVKVLQNGLRVMPLSEFLGTPAPAPAPAIEFPIYERDAAESERFIGYFNFLLGHSAVHPSEAGLLERFSAIGISPGRTFNSATQDPALRSAIRLGAVNGLTLLRKSVSIGRNPRGTWTVSDRVGDRTRMQGRYLERAAAAMFGLYGLDREEATYFGTQRDAADDFLDGGQQRYRLHFSRAQIPQVRGFWSLTIYDSEGFLVTNPIDRHSIGDRTPGLRFGPDGSLTLYLQHHSPGPAQESNWLPAPAGRFSVALRTYLPELKTFDTYLPPPVTRAQ